ncbi:4-coumarate--CoA ligase-like 9 isoform X1 [Castanea sativa]|uniref:4-coumarate--CoA ligase-like 9 isoform X1 n=1 Tax=Castanea sativa TaxID=21020 RepID=UPI003F6530F9
MANHPNHHNSTIDPNSGFCSQTKIYHSLRPTTPLPPLTTPLSITDYLFPHLNSSPPPPTTTTAAAAALIDSTTRRRISFPDFARRIQTLTSSLQNRLHLSKGDTAFILSPNSLHIPILHFSLISLGVVVSPSNPSSTKPEISRQIHLSKPVIAFATSETAAKIPSLRYGTVLLDSPEFESLMTRPTTGDNNNKQRVTVNQSDTATILYSSGTTGRVKGVELTHRNWISVMAGVFAARELRSSPAVTLCTVPFFHVYGMGLFMRELAMGHSVVVSTGPRFDLTAVMRAIEEFRVTHVALAPPVAVAMTKGNVMDGYDLRSLEVVACGGASLQRSVIVKFTERFPNLQFAQAYGLTESTGRVFGTVGLKECGVVGATGKLFSNSEAKIVDPDTGIALPPMMPGELWLRGSSIMKGYVGDAAATAEILGLDGWLRTGDLCYFDNEGFLFFLERIKELIKYKGYQVAPAELEYLLHSHPDVADVAVAPYPDEEVGQLPMAFIVRRNGSTIDEPQIMDFVAKQVAPYKRIRRVMFVDMIPKNAPGKVLRKELIKLALSKANSKL